MGRPGTRSVAWGGRTASDRASVNTISACELAAGLVGQGITQFLDLGSGIPTIPNYIITKHIPLFGGNDILGNGGHGWLDSYWGLIMPGTVSAFGTRAPRAGSNTSW